MPRPPKRNRRADLVAERARLDPGVEGQVNAPAALARMAARGIKPKRQIRSRRYQATCQYPDGSPLHTFEYVRTTKPQVYCEPHRKGWEDEDGFRHGGERHVRVRRDPETGEVIARYLVAEKHVPVTTVLGPLRRKGARWLQWIGIDPSIVGLTPDPDGPTPIPPGGRVFGAIIQGAMGFDWVRARVRALRTADSDPADHSSWITREVEGDPFHWRVTDRIESPGIVATTEVIVTENPRSAPRIGEGEPIGEVLPPRFDPALVRELTTEEVEVKPGGPALSLNTPVGDGHEAIDFLSEDGLTRFTHDGEPYFTPLAEPEPAIRPDPAQHPPLMPNATPLHWAVGRALLGIARAPDYWFLIRPAQRRDALAYAQIVRDVALLITEARMLDAGKRVSPVLNSEAPKEGAKSPRRTIE